MPCARWSMPGTPWRCSTICRPATRKPLPAGVALVRAAIHDRDAVRQLLVEHRADAVMHFAAWLDGRRVGATSRSSITRTTSPARCRVLDGDARRRREAVHLLVDLRGLRRADERCRSSRVCRQASDQRLRRDQADDRTRAAAPRARARPAAGSRCAISTPQARIRTAPSAKITPTKST